MIARAATGTDDGAGEKLDMPEQTPIEIERAKQMQDDTRGEAAMVVHEFGMVDEELTDAAVEASACAAAHARWSAPGRRQAKGFARHLATQECCSCCSKVPPCRRFLAQAFLHCHLRDALPGTSAEQLKQAYLWIVGRAEYQRDG